MSDAGQPTLTSLTINNRIARDIAAFLGELARPFAMISISACSAWAVIDHAVDATKLGVALTGVGALYGSKAWEKVAQTRADADVKKANGGS